MMAQFLFSMGEIPPKEEEKVIIGKYIVIIDNHDVIETGDYYLAGRNGPDRVLRCKNTVWDQCAKNNEYVKNKKGVTITDSKFSGWVNADTLAYNYDFYECRKIIRVEDGTIDDLWMQQEEEYEKWQKKFWAGGPAQVAHR
jgi:hypothetical protein